MITVRLAYAAAPSLRPRPGAEIRPGAHVVIELGRLSGARPAPPPRPLRLAQRLAAPLADGAPHREPSLARTEAARAFAEGTFLLPGQIIDRRA
ncbi:MAG: hypothetical protein DI556_16450 [Rhodovulum sulfidophilum]|uniref:Uncharacterized protein n=1 Tax=Rhodovulum sulfidophilum TaxID=35806 RepID=A0A2W5N2X6_RHOSU|nr:MAG: hypothetical protein DI556_16450 [Rhodovulum sulfidophilum]